MEDTQRVWPRARILVTGEPDGLEDMESLYYLPKPIDYAGLICKVQSLKEEPAAKNQPVG